jgi:hypothetical protein
MLIKFLFHAPKMPLSKNIISFNFLSRQVSPTSDKCQRVIIGVSGWRWGREVASGQNCCDAVWGLHNIYFIIAPSGKVTVMMRKRI